MDKRLLKTLYKELYRKSFYEFIKKFWSAADPKKFIDGKLPKFYAEVFQYFCKDWVGYDAIQIDVPTPTAELDVIDVRQGKRNLCLNVPPRHSKSMIFNVLGPTWLWLSDPVKAVSISHTGALASQMNSKRYAIINSPEFKELYADEIKLVANTKSFLKDARGGELYSLNRNAMTGYGGDIIINDDLTNAEAARKDKNEMFAAWSYYQNTMPSRINDMNKYIIINIQQRLAPNDITGHILNEPALRNQYCFITLPAIFKKDTVLVCPISGDLIYYKKGEGLWPERFGDYKALMAEVGSNIFQTQYMQDPIASDATLIKSEDIIEKDMTEVPDIMDANVVYASHDFPVKDKESSDFLGSVLGYKVGSTLYIKDCLERRMPFKQSVNYVNFISDNYPGSIQIIEDKANGSPILNQLQDIVAGMTAFQPGTNSKSQRLDSASLYMSAGNVVFVRSVWDETIGKYRLSDNLVNLKTRLLNFPMVEHDDIVDAFSMLLLFVFMDKQYEVYGRSFNDANMIDEFAGMDKLYSNVFVNKEADIWKACEIAIKYGQHSELILLNEHQFKASPVDGLNELARLYPTKKVFIDCSAVDTLYGNVVSGHYVERYEAEDFAKSVGDLSLAMSKKLVKIMHGCKLTVNDIHNFKLNRNKDQTATFRTQRDGFVACLRIAMKYYGGIQ